MSAPQQNPFLRAARELLAGLLEQCGSDGERREALTELARWLAAELAARAPAQATEVLGPALQPTAPPEPPRVEARPLSIGGKTVVVAARVAEGALDPRVPISLEGRVILPEEPTRARQPARPRSGNGAGPGPGPRAEEDWPWVLERTRDRARLKAEACHWALRRNDDIELVEAAREALLVRARELGGFLPWPLDRARARPEDPLLELCAEAYENLAQVVEVVLSTRTWITGAVAPPEELLFLAAEVQSALRGALIEADVFDDPDQLDVFIWVKELGYRHSIYVPRHLRREDPADPAEWLERRERLDALGERLRREEDDKRERKRLVDKLHYQVSRLARAGDPSERRTAWMDVLRTLDLWVEGRRPPTSPDYSREVGAGAPAVPMEKLRHSSKRHPSEHPHGPA